MRLSKNFFLLSFAHVFVCMFCFCQFLWLSCVCVSVSELSPMLRGCGSDWQWCMGTLIIQSQTWLMVDSLPPCPAPPQDTPAWSCHVRHTCAYSQVSLSLCLSSGFPTALGLGKQRELQPFCWIANFPVGVLEWLSFELCIHEWEEWMPRYSRHRND